MFRDYFVNWERGRFHFNQIASGQNALGIFLWGGLTPSGTCYSRKEFLNIGGFLVRINTLARSDYVTMWELVLDNFEFEMSDRIFFRRQFASTASGTQYIEKEIDLSIVEC